MVSRVETKASKFTKRKTWKVKFDEMKWKFVREEKLKVAAANELSIFPASAGRPFVTQTSSRREEKGSANWHHNNLSEAINLVICYRSSIMLAPADVDLSPRRYRRKPIWTSWLSLRKAIASGEKNARKTFNNATKDWITLMVMTSIKFAHKTRFEIGFFGLIRRLSAASSAFIVELFILFHLSQVKMELSADMEKQLRR